MILLSVDTCAPRGSVALLLDGKAVQVVPHDSPEEYSSWLLPIVGHLLKEHALTMTDVEAYAVAVGPGSFTGVRVGLTTVKAWAEVYGRKIAPVSRLEALASQREDRKPLVAAFLDGSRGQIFGAVYDGKDGELQLVGDESVMDPEAFLAFAEGSAGGRELHWISSDPEKMEATAAWQSSKVVHEPIQRISPCFAEAIGRIGYRKVLNHETVDSLMLDANYVRKPDAEIRWKGLGTAGAMKST